MITANFSTIQHTPLETTKAHTRRERVGFFEKYCKGKGLDVGGGLDPVCDGIDVYDHIYGDSDATYLKEIADNVYDFVYSSHCIEHVLFAEEAIRNWFRVLRTNGYLIIAGPERDLYERQKTLPSRWNGDHKTFWKLYEYEPPCTFSVINTIYRALIIGSDSFRIISADVCAEGWQELPLDVHPIGEYSWEVVVQKS